MIMKILIWLSILWIAPLMCFLLRNEAKFKKNIVVGVTLPLEGREDEEVLARLKSFRKTEVLCCFLLLLLPIPCLFAETFNLTMTLWFTWLLVGIVIPYIPYVLCNKKLHRIKQQRRWLRFTPGKITVDTAVIPEPRWLSPVLFLIPLLISLLPLIWERSFWFLYLVDAACIFLFWLCYRYLYRNKAEKVDENADLTDTLTRVRRRYWGTVWIASSYAMAAMNLGIAISHAKPLAMLFVTLGFALVITIFVVRVEIKTRSIQEKLTAQSGHSLYIDDDDKWIWGFIYYNPHDSHTFINDRVGINMTFNLARPLGKALAVLTITCLLALPFMIPIVNSCADKPPVMTYTNTLITAKSGGTEYEIPLSDIKQLQLLDQLPEDLYKVIGTNLSALLKGEFTSKKTGRVEVCLDPTCPPYILVITDNNRRYLFGTRDANKTKAVYKKLSEELTAQKIM